MKVDRRAVDQLQILLDSSGLNVTEFARLIPGRQPSTVYRWLRGESPVPESVREWLEEQSA